MANVMTIASCHFVGTSRGEHSDRQRRRRRDRHGLIRPLPTAGQALEEVVAQRQRLAAQDHHEHDDDERHRLGEAGRA